ncbi:hypothetical protein L873DRAFT_759703 [Choiromyces venosus 120613-1]|uniref:F-box domain-containing protein n=1 Tax=Choiromyces venosus 120613-1 TaxID=1336337 RepID=A0A3N4JQP4_9PEZI|nr:hypothetical protein L873DRAFT_759703 [Choiromyces venosus 120613-1]
MATTSPVDSSSSASSATVVGEESWAGLKKQREGGYVVEGAKTSGMDGFRGMQAPAAEILHQEGLPGPFLFQQARSQSSARFTLPSSSSSSSQKLPRLPTEVHMQIIRYLLPDSAASAYEKVPRKRYALGCGFCNLFTLSSLCSVNKLYSSIVSEMMYSTLSLNLSTQLSPTLASYCRQHHHLSSKHLQLEKRLPLLLRTLHARPELAVTVKALHLPPNMTHWLTCKLEKHLLPDLINTCENLQIILGVEQLLLRKFFSAEHYCLDNSDNQHGPLAKALVEKKTLTRFVWRGGAAGGAAGEVWRRVFDGLPGMDRVGFIRMHKTWNDLQELGIFGVSGLLTEGMKIIFNHLHKLEKVHIGGLRRKRVAGCQLKGEAEFMLEVVRVLPRGVKNIGLSDVEDESFPLEVVKWVRERVCEMKCAKHTAPSSHGCPAGCPGSSLQSLSFSRIAFTLETLEMLVRGLAIPVSSDYHHNRTSYRSAVIDLRVSNAGFDHRVTPRSYTPTAETQLAGLRRLCWGVAGAECFLWDTLKNGAGMVGLKEVVVEVDSEVAREACTRRGVRMVGWDIGGWELNMVDW